MASRVRLDKLLVDKGLLPTREKAIRSILAGDILVDGRRVDKAGALVEPYSVTHGLDRAADGRRVAVGDEEDAVERHRLAGPGCQELDLELRADLDAVLLPAGLDDCVHGSSGRDVRSRGNDRGLEFRKRHLGSPRRERGLYGELGATVNLPCPRGSASV